MLEAQVVANEAKVKAFGTLVEQVKANGSKVKAFEGRVGVNEVKVMVFEAQVSAHEALAKALEAQVNLQGAQVRANDGVLIRFFFPKCLHHVKNQVWQGTQKRLQHQ